MGSLFSKVKTSLSFVVALFINYPWLFLKKQHTFTGLINNWETIQIDNQRSTRAYMVKSDQQNGGASLVGDYDSPKVIVLLHDQGETSDGYLGYAQQLALITKLNVFVVEYFGCNLGDKHMPTEKSAYESLYAVVKHLNKQYGIANSDIILYGHGLGASVVVSVARSLANTATLTNNGAKTEEVAGVILSAPQKFITQSFFGRWIFSNMFFDDEYQSSKIIREIACPLLILHGIYDQTVHIAHSERLVHIASSNLPLVKLQKLPCSHNDIFFCGHMYREAVTDFVRTIQSRVEEPLFCSQRVDNIDNDELVETLNTLSNGPEPVVTDKEMGHPNQQPHLNLLRANMNQLCQQPNIQHEKTE